MIGVVCSVGVGSDRGGRERNEDNYLVCRDGTAVWLEGDAEKVRPAQGEGVLLAVCDGMGGHEDGDVASTSAVRVLSKLYRPGVPRDPPKALRRYILDSHRTLHWKAREQGPVTMGTTLTTAWLLHGAVHWAHVGDSRLYLFREDELTQLTDDQTRNAFRERDGRETSPQGDHLAQSFLYGSRGLGDNSRLRIEPGKDTGSRRLQDRDRLLLCTDGVHAAVDDTALRQLLADTSHPQAAAVACMERAIARGSTDNITALVVDVPRVERPEHVDESDAWSLDEEETMMI